MARSSSSRAVSFLPAAQTLHIAWMCLQPLNFSQLHFLTLASLPAAQEGRQWKWDPRIKYVFKSHSGTSLSCISKTVYIRCLCWSLMSQERPKITHKIRLIIQVPWIYNGNWTIERFSVFFWFWKKPTTWFDHISLNLTL